MQEEKNTSLGYSLIDSKFTILECLGVGSTSSVYKVCPKGRTEPVLALKVLHPSLMRDETIAKRFQRELLASYTVNHPNVVRAYDFIRQGSVLSYSMEYLSGGSLRKKLTQSGKMSKEQIIKATVQLAAGIGAIHDAGIIHRDLKPENVLLSNKGVVKISDFGIAKVVNSKTLTKKGEILGAVEYCSPEYIEGGAFDERSDIYSFGLIIYEMVVGRRAFEGKNAFNSLMTRINTVLELPEDVAKTTSPALREIVKKCCSIDPSQRYRNATEILDFLFENERSASEGVVEVSSSHHVVISLNKNDAGWNSSLWKGIEDKSSGANKKVGKKTRLAIALFAFVLLGLALLL